MGEPNKIMEAQRSPLTGSKQESVPQLGLLGRKVRAGFLNLLGRKGSRLPGRPSLMLWAVGMGVGQGGQGPALSVVPKGT